MSQRIARYALARAVLDDEAQAPYRALRGYDPWLRTRARRTMRRALAESQQLASTEDPKHSLRLALVRLVDPSTELDFDDVEGIRSRAHELASAIKPPRRGPWLVALLGLLIVLAIALPLALRALLRPFDPTATPPGMIFAEDVPNYVIALARPPEKRGGDLAAARQRATGTEARRSLGGEITDRLRSLFDAAERVQAESRPESARQFLREASRLSESLAAARLPYFVDGTFLKEVPVLLSFYVEREAQARTDNTSVRVVYLWRLDTLNLVQGLLGYTRDTNTAAVVLLDQVENHLVRFVLPAIVPGEPMIVVDDETRSRKIPWIDAVMANTAALVRRHYDHARPSDPQTLARVGELVARRRTLLEKWQATLAGQQRRLRLPRRLIPERDYAEDLSLKVTRSQLREWEDLHEELLSPRLVAAFEQTRDEYLESVARHEVQHRLDFARGKIPVPELLTKRLGGASLADAPPGTLAARSRDELSASLAELAQGSGSPLLALVLIARHLFDRTSLGGPYSYAGLGVLEALGLELDVDTESILGSGVVSRERSARLLDAVTRHPPEAIQQAAARAFEKAFGRKLEVVRFEALVQNERWRH